MGKQTSDTRDKILDAAEELFADRGINGVSIRQITAKANVRLASVNYYFGNKPSLYTEVLLRRANILSAERLKLLRAIDPENLPVELALQKYAYAFIHPLLERTLKGGLGWQSYCRLVAATATLSVNGPTIARVPFDKTALEFTEVITRILPTISERNSFYAYQFMVGSTLYIFTQSYRLDMLSSSKYSSSDLDQICTELIAFVAAGLKSLE